jgi:hypothetical protein
LGRSGRAALSHGLPSVPSRLAVRSALRRQLQIDQVIFVDRGRLGLRLRRTFQAPNAAMWRKTPPVHHYEALHYGHDIHNPMPIKRQIQASRKKIFFFSKTAVTFFKHQSLIDVPQNKSLLEELSH